MDTEAHQNFMSVCSCRASSSKTFIKTHVANDNPEGMQGRKQFSTARLHFEPSRQELSAHAQMGGA